MSYRIDVNGTEHEIDVDGDMPLLWVLRETLGLTGTKFGCGIGACGACTIHVDGAVMRSCVVPVRSVAGRRVTTIEGLASGASPHRVQAAWIEHQVPQCGYCQSGMIMAVAALLQTRASPSDAEIDASVTNICRCGTYERIRLAIRALADQAQPLEPRKVSHG
jgi:isoquinoline 1-oxidoreductase alpha subunit